MGSNHVGQKAQAAQKCATSKILDDVFPEGEEIQSFSIPSRKKDMLNAQLRSARHMGSYEPLPDLSVAESLTIGLLNPSAEGEQTKFSYDSDDGWHSQQVTE